MTVRDRVLNKRFKELKQNSTILSIRSDQNKITDGKKTDVEAITFYVSEKKAEKFLAPQDIIPKEIDGIPTDVVELSSPDFKLGRTSIGDLPPHLQRRLMGVMKE